MSSLFSRSYQVVLGTPTNPAQAVYGNIPQGAYGEVTPLRVSFEIKKTPQSSANKGSVSLWNMSATNRANVTPGLLVVLTAGYVGNANVVFTGIVAKSMSERQGPDIVTKLECGDGEAAISQTHIHRSYPNKTTLAQVFTDIATSLKDPNPYNPAPVNSGIAVGLPEVVFDKGLVIKGMVQDVMRKLCRSNGLQWSIQNGALNIIPVGGSTQQTAVLLTPSTGLLGVPSLNGQNLMFQCLINPSINPGSLVKIQSEVFEGLYVVKNVDMEGDSHDQPWTFKCEGVFLKQQNANLPAAQGLNYEEATE